MTAPLARPVLRHHIGVMSDRLTFAVQRALETAPCSIRRLAVVADVPHSTLVRIQSGERAATLAVADAVIQALEQWGKDCTRAAHQLRQVRQQRKGTQ